jgi:uncharacterized protein GlcG (DUF336 family)/mannose-6-phosphate isomerase-like protein (cupin superfamily)
MRPTLWIRLLCAALMLANSALPALADVAQKPTLTLEVARTAVAAAVAHARTVNAPGGAIAVVDDGGSVVLVERLDGTFPAGPDISIGKARTAAAFHQPTRTFEELVNKGRTTMVTLPAVTHFTPLRGGVPLMISGHVVGGIGVSGAASAAQDDEIAQAGADRLAKSEPLAEVTLIPQAAVADAFRGGSPLAATSEYSVHASRRDGPGSAEVHVHDTDIFYVLSGAAVVVTGGQVVDPKQAGAGELRGTAIEGGIERDIGAGDVVTIPRGVPHWFKNVQAPLTYFVVKATAPDA